MEAFYLEDLKHAIYENYVMQRYTFPIKGISIDSRTIKYGEIYFALHGARYDGHNFIKEAVDKGAIAVVCSRSRIGCLKYSKKHPLIFETDDTLVALGKVAKLYKEKFKNTKIIGITGSNGKTTTKEMLLSILSKKYKTLSSNGNFNNRVGVPFSIFNLTSEIEYGIFEMGTSLHGEIEILANILNPDVGIITNIGPSHLETFVSRKHVFEEKKVLFDNIKKNGFIVVNNDDVFLKKAHEFRNYKGRIVTFSLSAFADVYAKDVTMHLDKINFELCYKTKSIKIELPAKGKFNVSNALAAASCAVGLKFSLSEIKLGIEDFVLPKMRMECVVTKIGAVLINDAYNANPSSIKEAIETVLQCYPEKKINLVIGDMLELGDKSIYYHSKLGKFINDKNINSVYLLGELSVYIKKSLSIRNVFHSKNPDALLKKLEQTPVDNDSVFLFKASRAIRLEEVYIKFYNFLCYFYS
jgi:UDP-N-acetylmuramoyl-tripeptide--D-alanyl-D-alanine ligase